MQSRWGWLLFSIALAETANLGLILFAWIQHRNDPNWNTVSTWTAHLQQRPWIPLIRLPYIIGLPAYAYLTQGALTARGLGLQSIGGRMAGPSAVVADWAADLGWAALIAVSVWLAVIVGRSQAAPQRSVAEAKRGSSSSPALLEALFHQVHWAFYREPFVLVLGLSLGSWVGAGVAALEALTNPAWWADIRSAHRKEAIVNYGALLVASTLLYGLTRNLWIAILTGGILRWSLGLRTPTQVVRA